MGMGTRCTCDADRARCTRASTDSSLVSGSAAFAFPCLVASILNDIVRRAKARWGEM